MKRFSGSVWSFLTLSAVSLLQSSSYTANAQFAACSICANNMPVVGSPGTVLPQGTGGVLMEDQTCEETETLAMEGAYSAAICVLLRGSSEICGCKAKGAPTAAPVAAETGEPTASPNVAPTTKAPTVAPTPAPSVVKTTDAPTAAPTAAPLVVPTKVPTAAPIIAITTAPTMAPAVVNTTKMPTSLNVTTLAPATTAVNVTVRPTAAPIKANVTVAPTAAPIKANVTTAPAPTPVATTVPLDGSALIRIESVPGNLTDEAEMTYVKVCKEFFTKYLSPNVTDIKCELASQSFTPAVRNSTNSSRRRLLRRSLQGGNISATAQEGAVDTVAQLSAKAVADADADPTSFNQLLQDTVNMNAEDFATMLLNSGDPFFQRVASVEAFQLTGVPAPATPAPDGVSPVAAPTANTGSDDTLSGGAIFGIVAAVAVGVVALVVGAQILKKNATLTSNERAVHTVSTPIDLAEPEVHVPVMGPTAKIQVAAAPSSIASSANPAAVAAVAMAAAISEAASVVSVADSESRAGGVKASSASTAGDSHDAAGSEYESGDAMSYAYSLDAGNVDQASTKGAGGADGSKNRSSGESGPGTTMSHSADEMSSHAMSSLRENMISRTVIAPPGKLGIVIDTTLEGPVVHKVNPQSPLEGVLFPGDIIVAIDDVDTRAMSASAITNLMVQTANLRRKLTILSEDVTN